MGLRRAFSYFDPMNSVTGAIVGSDIYIIPGITTGLVGPLATLVWIIGRAIPPHKSASFVAHVPKPPASNSFNSLDPRPARLQANLQQALKDVMRDYPQAVTVVTARAEDGLKGITVSSFISVSLEPPLILVSIAKSAAEHEALTNAKTFVVNFLADDQMSLSERFAGRTALNDRFEGLAFRSESTSAPIIEGVRAFVECKSWRVHEEGDHSLIIGEVVSAKKLDDRRPLVYQNQRYTTTVPP